MPVFKISVDGLKQADTGLRTFAATVTDLTTFWRLLGRSLADEAQRRWPLRRRSGRLRKSLVWSGGRLGKGGVYESSPDRLTFGTAVFYSIFSQHGTKRQKARPLIHVNPDEHTEQLRTWLQARAVASGLEIT